MFFIRYILHSIIFTVCFVFIIILQVKAVIMKMILIYIHEQKITNVYVFNVKK